MRLTDISWPKAKEYFENSDMVIIGLGCIENHGRHNVLGVDTLIPEYLLNLIEEKSDVLIAPTIPYGSTDDYVCFPGSVSLGDELMFNLLKKISMDLFSHGARKFVFLNGHGGNVNALTRTCVELSKAGGLGAILNWWVLAGEINPNWKGGHGSGQETAAMLAIDHKLVDQCAIAGMELKNDLGEGLPTAGFDRVKFKEISVLMPRMCERYVGNGWIGPDPPETATQEWGKEMLAATADFIVEFMEEFKKAEI